MPELFCQRCWDEFLQHMEKAHGLHSNITPIKEDFVARCKVPMYKAEFHGRPTVQIWNCETRRFDTYSQEDWNKKKARGES